jgi:SsrA-binding protein
MAKTLPWFVFIMSDRYNGFMKLLAKNRRATFDYDIGEKLVAGLVLSGPEVKSAKAGNVSLKGSFITIKDSEAWLNNAYFTPYGPASRHNPVPDRTRKLLLHRKQLSELIGSNQAGVRAVPMALLLERGLIKLEIGIGRGKKRYDKRETIKRRTQEREAERQVKSR